MDAINFLIVYDDSYGNLELLDKQTNVTYKYKNLTKTNIADAYKIGRSHKPNKIWAFLKPFREEAVCQS